MCRWLLVALAMVSTPAAAEVVGGTAAVADGDTLEVDGRRIRLFGIDAPELAQTCERDGATWACGEEARSQLAALIGDRRVECSGNQSDTFGRLLAVCSVGATDLNRTMVEYGWATAFRRYSDDYVAFEVRARQARLGLWRSSFQLPEDYRLAEAERLLPPAQTRAALRQQAPSARASEACVIKGNRNSRGEWIYHLPGRPYYAQTRAEEMFCTEEEARAAGYRRSRA
jgi:endonuclease YncB( thermonuclease family)